MQPNGTDKNDSAITPKYRHFPDGGEIVVFNPLDRDVVYNVATDQGRFTYVLKKNKRSILQGGLIATLGVKNIVDELMLKDEKLQASIWDLKARAKIEGEIILREKQPIQHAVQTIDNSQPIDLSADANDEDVDILEVTDDLADVPEFTGENHNVDETNEDEEEGAFPELDTMLANSIAAAPPVVVPQDGEED